MKTWGTRRAGGAWHLQAEERSSGQSPSWSPEGSQPCGTCTVRRFIPASSAAWSAMLCDCPRTKRLRHVEPLVQGLLGLGLPGDHMSLTQEAAGFEFPLVKASRFFPPEHAFSLFY